MHNSICEIRTFSFFQRYNEVTYPKFFEGDHFQRGGLVVAVMPSVGPQQTPVDLLLLKIYPLQHVLNISKGNKTCFISQFLSRTLSIFEFQFSFPLIWDKIFGILNHFIVSKPLWVHHWYEKYNLYIHIYADLVIQITSLRMTAPLRRNHILDR